MGSTDTPRRPGRPRRVLAVASGGGHWIQLMRLRDAFAGCEVRYATTDAAFAHELRAPVHVLPDANANRKLAMLALLCKAVWVVLRTRPDVIVTTGAAPGLACLVAGRLTGRRTVWIDSIANSEELSRSGAQARRWADLWLTQWPDLAKPEGPACWGAVV